MRKIYIITLIVVMYAACLAWSYWGTHNFIGVLGRLPFALFGDRASIIYMYNYYAFNEYSSSGESFWLKRAAYKGIPQFQRLYGERLLKTDFNEGIDLLKRAADANDYYAAVTLTSIYE